MFADSYGDILGDVAHDIQVDPLNSIVSSSRCWPDGVLHYQLSSSFTSFQRGLNQKGIDDLVDSVKVNGRSCISIRPRSFQKAYVSIIKGSGCSSYIGRIGGSQEMSLVDGCVNRHGTIMHEFLHALGFYHEQSRSDRDDHVDVRWDNIRTGTETNFMKYSEGDINLLGTLYDYSSVMHYSAYAFANNPTIPTIVTSDPSAMSVIGQRLKLSDLDIERVQILYGCLTPGESKHFQHLRGKSLPTCAGK